MRERPTTWIQIYTPSTRNSLSSNHQKIIPLPLHPSSTSSIHGFPVLIGDHAIALTARRQNGCDWVPMMFSVIFLYPESVSLAR